MWIEIWKWVASRLGGKAPSSNGPSHHNVGKDIRSYTASSPGAGSISQAGLFNRATISDDATDQGEVRAEIAVGSEGDPEFIATIYNSKRTSICLTKVILVAQSQSGEDRSILLRVKGSSSGGNVTTVLPRHPVQYVLRHHSREDIEEVLSCPHEGISLSVCEYEGEIKNVRGEEILPKLKYMAARKKEIEEEAKRREKDDHDDSMFRTIDP
jgi:hypothetical protein